MIFIILANFLSSNLHIKLMLFRGQVFSREKTAEGEFLGNPYIRKMLRRAPKNKLDAIQNKEALL